MEAGLLPTERLALGRGRTSVVVVSRSSHAPRTTTAPDIKTKLIKRHGCELVFGTRAPTLAFEMKSRSHNRSDFIFTALLGRSTWEGPTTGQQFIERRLGWSDLTGTPAKRSLWVSLQAPPERARAAGRGQR